MKPFRRPAQAVAVVLLALLTSTSHGRYTVPLNGTGTNPPREFGVTFRLDF